MNDLLEAGEQKAGEVLCPKETSAWKLVAQHSICNRVLRIMEQLYTGHCESKGKDIT